MIHLGGVRCFAPSFAHPAVDQLAGTCSCPRRVAANESTRHTNVPAPVCGGAKLGNTEQLIGLEVSNRASPGRSRLQRVAFLRQLNQARYISVEFSPISVQAVRMGPALDPS